MSAPLLTPREWSDMWQALKGFVEERHDNEHSLMESFQGHLTGATSGAQVSVLRDVLAKMRELEAGK